MVAHEKKSFLYIPKTISFSEKYLFFLEKTMIFNFASQNEMNQLIHENKCLQKKVNDLEDRNNHLKSEIKQLEANQYILSEIVCSDRDIMTRQISGNGLKLKFATSLLKKDQAFVSQAVKNNPHSFQYASPELKNDPMFVKQLLKEINWHESLFQHLGENLKKNKQFMMDLVEKNGFILKYLDPDMIDRKMVIKALQNNKKCFLFIPPSFLEDENFVFENLIMTMKEKFPLKLLPESLMHKIPFLKRVVSLNGMYLKYLPNTLQDNEDLVIPAIQQNYHCLEFVSKRLKSDSDFMAFVIVHEKNKHRQKDFFQYVDPELTNDRHFMEKVCLQNPELRVFASPTIQNSDGFKRLLYSIQDIGKRKAVFPMDSDESPPEKKKNNINK